jgi:hypothetical protein
MDLGTLVFGVCVFVCVFVCVCVCVCVCVSQVTTGLGEQGVIESSFGKSGKQKVTFANGLAAPASRTQAGNVVTLLCKRYLFDEAGRKKLRQ